jgi:hypothetical protein
MMPPNQYTVFEYPRFLKLDLITRTSFLLEEARTFRIDEISDQSLLTHCDRETLVSVRDAALLSYFTISLEPGVKIMYLQWEP